MSFRRCNSLLLECPLYTNARMQLFMNITPYTVISIENLLFGSDNLTDENNLIVFRNVQNIYTILIDLNDTKLYSVLRMLSFIFYSIPLSPLFSSLLLFIKYIHVYIYYIMQLAVIFLFIYITLLHRADILS
jgi:hypothetical protein